MNKNIKILLLLFAFLLGTFSFSFTYGQSFNDINATISIEGLPFSESGWYPGAETEKANFTIENNEDFDLQFFFGARLDSEDPKLAEVLILSVAEKEVKLIDLFDGPVDLGSVSDSASFDLSIHLSDEADHYYQDKSIEFTFLFGVEDGDESRDTQTGSTRSLVSISLAGDFEEIDYEEIYFEHFFSPEEEPEECPTFLNEFIRFGDDNNPQEVRKLQSFLNVVMDADLPVDGIYDLQTMEAVNAFQVRYKEEILRPWVEEGIHDDEEMPTGYVFLTTRRWINMMMCPEDYLAMPNLSIYAQETLQEVVDEIEFDIGEIEWEVERVEEPEEIEDVEAPEDDQVELTDPDPFQQLAAAVGGIEIEERAFLLLALIIISLIAIIFYLKRN